MPTLAGAIERDQPVDLRHQQRPRPVPGLAGLLGDQHEAFRQAAQPGQVLSRVVLMARWQPTREFAAVFDCSAARRADLLDEVSFGEEGKLLGARWIALAPEDPLLRAACLESGAG
jgi:hypothetical protein